MGYTSLGQKILELFFNVMFSDSTGEMWNTYQNAVQEQIRAGFDVAEAQTRTAFDLLDTDPNFQAARDVLEEEYRNAPPRLRREYDRLITGARDDRTAFQEQLAGVGEGFQERENNVMAMLEGQGRQAKKDIDRAFGESEAAALGSLTEQGLSGSGVGASVRGGFATRKSDALAKLNEELALLQANAYSGLSGERLGFGANAAQLGYGAGQYVTGLGENRINLGFDAQTAGASNLANYYSGMGQTALNQLNLGAQNQLDFIEGINLVPPDTSRSSRGWSDFSKGFGNSL